ncbi:hypothetical protein ACFV20_35535 [Streptomyces sp. NPDC059696]|uniref:hypothetical protein n=1 Tax=Streptomyces sp. NPDC059696 TaxID=3346911 RepID=UPI003691BAD4
MSNPAAFRDRSNWSGGFYELAIEVGSTDDAALQAVLSAVWSAAEVRGTYALTDREPAEQEPVPCTVASLTEYGHLHGRVRLPTGQWVVCGGVAIRGGDDSSDWLDFYVPDGALDNAGVPHGDGRPFFRSAVLDDWLAGIGTAVFERVGFRLAVIGWEVSGCTDAATLAGRLPEERSIGYLLPREGGLQYGAAND